ncbi:MAG TPA: MASE1 domain-containing protein [Thermoanaerobaculia bacterium]|nr:MASE1 domain-containing protein [Thermoanaerobaculia bacterium]
MSRWSLAPALGPGRRKSIWVSSDRLSAFQRTALVAGTVAAAYFLGSLLGLSFQFPGTQISAIWPPNAILLATLLVTPRHRWWIYLLAVLPAHFLAQGLMGIPFPIVLINFAGNVGDALLGALAVVHLAEQPLRFDRLRTMGLIMFFGGLVAPALVSLAVGELFVMTGASPEPWLAWRLRLLTNTLAVFTLVPPIVMAAARIPFIPPWRRVEATALLAGLLAVGTLVFVLPEVGLQQILALLYVPLPFLLWAAVRFGLPGVSLSVLTLGAMAMWGVLSGRGPFATDLPIENATSLTLFLIVVCAPLLLLAALVEEHRATEEDRRRTEQEAREQRRELAHLTRVVMLGELSGALAHELNQPLTAILSNAQAAQRLLAMEPVDLEEVRDALQEIASEDIRAGAVIQRLRAMLKKERRDLESLDLSAITWEVLALAHSDLVTRNVSVITRLAPYLPAVRGDRVQLQQVLLNLILNACEAMSGVAPRDRQLTLAITHETDGIHLSLGDRGVGIPSGAMDRVFEPFFTTKEHGLGLGLAICRSIVVEHGGRLWASDGEAGGATFHLLLPATA